MTNELSGVERLAAALREGAVSSSALTEEALARASGSDAALLTLVTAERARAEAQDADLRLKSGRPRGLLDGLPTVWKDLFALKGHTTTAGSAVTADAAPEVADAAAVTALATAGMVSLGRVNMSEFAFSGLGLNPHYGTPLNARSPQGSPRVPGGSSSGSAVAVAAGIVPVAVGTDTGGSVRVPAAFNGIVGYKSSRGRHRMEGVFPLSQSLDTLGVFAHSVSDAAIVDAAMRLRSPSLPARPPASKLRLRVPTNVVFDAAEPAVLANFEASLERLARAGITIERGPIAELDAVQALFDRCGPLVAAEAYRLHTARVSDPAVAARMDRRVVDRIRLGARTTDPLHAELLAERTRLIAAACRHFSADTLVAYPTVPHVAPLLAPLEADPALFADVNAKTLRNTALGSFLDWCGLSLPNGCDQDGLPTGLLLNGRPAGDDFLFSAALTLEPLVRGDT